MTKAEFRYHAPTTLAEVLRLLSSSADLQPLAGGYVLVPQVSRAGSASAGVVDLRNVPNLDQIATQQDGYLRVGGMVTLERIASDISIRSNWSALSDAASLVGDDQTRAHATLGGAVAIRADRGAASASGPNDMHAALLALDARVEVASVDGVSEVLIADILQNALPKGSLIVAVLIPEVGVGKASSYVKMRNPASLYPICGVASVVALGKSQQIKSLSLAVTGATDGTQRMAELESALVGGAMPQTMPVQGVNLEHCASDSFASADYRQQMTGVLAQDAIKSAIVRIK